MVNFKFRQFLPLSLSLLATVMAIAGNPATAQTESKASANIAQAPSQPLQSTELPIIPAQVSSLPLWIYPIGAGLIILILLPQVGWIAGLIVIGEREAGIITKKFSSKSLPAGRLIALKGEAGLQANTLPPGWHFGYFPWQYNVQKEALVVIPQDEIGLIIANDGAAIASNRILGKVTWNQNLGIPQNGSYTQPAVVNGQLEDIPENF